MASICAIGTAYRIAMSSCFGGMAINLTQKILTSPDFYALKRNKFVFSCIAVGSVTAVLYFLVAMHGYINPSQFYGFLLYWAWFLYSYCLYAILIERTVPLLRFSNNWSSQVRQLVRYFGPFLLALPQFVSSIIISQITGKVDVLATLFKVTEVMGFLGNFIGLFSNAGLSILFIYVLAKYRKQSLKNFVVENRVESINILFNLLVAWSFLFIKLFGTITSVAAPGRDPLLFTLFHNLFGPIVTLNTFGDYIYVTRKLPKEILSTQIDVTRKSDVGGKKSIAGTGTKLSSTTA